VLPKHTALEHVLRRAMRRAGIVTGYVHKCRRQGCGHHEAAADANPRRCPKCKFKLFPVGEVRKIRFHHLRHTTASLLLMQGADLAAVQRIMRHQDPRITTEVYGHLAPGYLKNEIKRLSFGPPPADLSAGAAPAGADAAPEAPTEQQSQIAASGAWEPPQLAVVRDDARPAAPFATRLLPNPQKAHAPPTRRGAVGKALRGLGVVGARGFEPPTFRSRNGMGTIAGGADPSQPGETITGGEGAGFQPSQGFAANERNSTTHLLPESGSAPGATIAPVGATRDEVPGWGHVAPGTAPRGRTTPTTADLVSYWGGRHQLLRVREVAEQLGVCNATVYRLVETGQLPHVRIVNSIRIRPGDMDDFIVKAGLR